MPKLTALLSVLVCLAAVGAARAAETTGWITDLDSETDEITLGTGHTFAVPDDISFASLSENVCVRIRYETVDGVRMMTGIAPVANVAKSRAAETNGPCGGPAARRGKDGGTDSASWLKQRRMKMENRRRPGAPSLRHSPPTAGFR